MEMQWQFNQRERGGEEQRERERQKQTYCKWLALSIAHRVFRLNIPAPKLIENSSEMLQNDLMTYTQNY